MSDTPQNQQQQSPQGQQAATYAIMLAKNTGLKQPGEIAQAALTYLIDAVFRISTGSNDPNGVLDTVIDMLQLAKTQLPEAPPT